MAKKKKDNNKYWRGCGASRTLIRSWREGNRVQPLLKEVRQFLLMLNTHTSHDPVIPFLGIYLSEAKTWMDLNVYSGFYFYLPKSGNNPNVLPLGRGYTNW